MEPFPAGSVIDGRYRIEAVLSTSEHAHVYVTTNIRFPAVPLALKVASLARRADFERDTAALSNLSTPFVSRVCDRGVLGDGRPWRVVERLVGPTLRETITTSTFDEARTFELLIALASAVHEAQAIGIGPCDLSVDNLMFAEGRSSKLCMLRAVVPETSDLLPAEAKRRDQTALSALRNVLERGRDAAPDTLPWQPPSSLAELREAFARTGGMPAVAPESAPGNRIGRWKIVRQLAESLQASVYEVTGNPGEVRVLKIATRPGTEEMSTHAQLLVRASHPNVARVFDIGAINGASFVVMERLEASLATELLATGPLGLDEALRVIDDLLAGAEAIATCGGGPCDFSLDHCFLVRRGEARWVLTHANAPVDRHIGFYGARAHPKHRDAWAACVAFYELVAGRLPFPTSRHSLARVWTGIPIPLRKRRRDVPRAISKLVSDVLAGDVKLGTRDLRRELARLRGLTPELATETPPPNIPTAPSPGHPKLEDSRSRAKAPVVVVPIVAVATAPTAMAQPPPADWRLELAATQCPIGPLTAAALRDEGREIVACSVDAVARYRRGRWTVDPARETDGAIRTLVPMGDAYLAITTTGALARVADSGAPTRWGPPLGQFVFRSAVAAPNGVSRLLSGSRQEASSTHGVIAELVGESVTILAEDAEARSFTAVTTLRDGSLLAVGERGRIVRLVGGRIVEAIRPCDVDLLGAIVSGDDILVVGDSAWAFRLTFDPMTAHLEPVDTLSGLTCLVVDERGNAWAGSRKGRILRRRERHWRRMNTEVSGDPAVLAIHVSATRLRAILANGQLVIGQPVG